MATLIHDPLPSIEAEDGRPWWKHLTGYHWFVFLVASAAWFFDCLDQRIFSLARVPALTALMHKSPAEVGFFGKVVTAYFLIGWGVGGMIFGALGDKYGRARMLTLTILIYSLFTGLSFFSAGKIDFTIYRFLTGMGVGGVFGLAVALIAETLAPVARAPALGLLQVLSTIGNLAAGLVEVGRANFDSAHFFPHTPWLGQGWRWMFLVGAVPAALVVFTGGFLREPEPWLRLKREGLLPKGGLFGPYVGLFTDRRWRRNVIVGSLIASTGVVGLWAIGEYAVDIQVAVFKSFYTAKGMSPDDVTRHVGHARSVAYILQMLGAGTGMWLFTRVATAVGRKFAFFLGFSSALIVTVFVYWKMKTPTDAYWMMPLMGAAQLSVFAGFAIYLPELFPSRLRSTGTGFCYNLGRFAAAGGSFFSAALATKVFGHFAAPLPARYSAMTMCAIFLVGLIVLPFAPETRGKPLPE